MQLKNLKDKDLLDNTKQLVARERQLLTEVLKHLREIERRRLFSTLGCSSLFEYCIEVLKYSESQAQRRISAMRLIREIPEIEEKVSKGELSLTNIAQAQSFFRQEGKAKAQPLSTSKKKAVLKGLENRSSRQGLKDFTFSIFSTGKSD